MADTSRYITKALAAQEDMLFGEGTTQQTRGGRTYTVSKLRGFYPCNSLTELNELDPDRFPKACTVINSSVVNYAHDGTSYRAVGEATVATIEEMQAIQDPMPGLVVHLTHPVRKGTFIATEGDFSAQIALDSNMGIYVSSGSVCLVRDVDTTEINVAWWGVSVTSTAEENTAGLLSIRKYLKDRGNYHTIINLPSGLLQYKTAQWLHGLKSIEVNGGPTRLQNVISDAEGETTANRIPLYLNAGYMQDGAFGSGDGFGTYNSGNLIASVSMGSTSITLKTAADSDNYNEGDRVFLYGWNQSSFGFPPSLRVFEHATVRASSGGVLTLASPIKYSYREDWHEIYNITDAPCGAARIINLDRGDDFTLCESFTLRNVEMMPSPEHVGAETSLGGSLYTYGAKNVVLENVKVNGYFYPGENNDCKLTNCDIKFAEIDKQLNHITSENTKWREVSNGPGCLYARFESDTILKPIANWSVKRADFVACEHKQITEGNSQLMLAGIGPNVERVSFINPKIHTGALTNKQVPLIEVDATESIAVTGVETGGIRVAYNGSTADPILLAVGVGTRLFNSNSEFYVTALYEDSGDTVILGDNYGDDIAVSDVLYVNKVSTVEIKNHKLLGVNPNNYLKNSGSSSDNIIDIIGKNGIDNAIIDSIYRKDKIIYLPFIDNRLRTGNSILNIAIYGRIKSILVNVTSPTTTPSAFSYIGRPSGEGTKPFQLNIDLTTAGVRYCDIAQTVGSVGSDTLVKLTNAYHLQLGFNQPTSMAGAEAQGYIIIELL